MARKTNYFFPRTFNLDSAIQLFLQIWGGSFYLANKILFALAEDKSEKRKRSLRIFGWSIYVLGVPAWVIILLGEQNWIAASIEAGGLPSMILGLGRLYKSDATHSRTLDHFASATTYAALLFGLSYSMIDNHGIGSITQILEICIMVGFLFGSYLLAKQNLYGWLFFMLMNISTSALMYTQNSPILCIQQLLSLCFVCYGFLTAVRIENRSACQAR